MSAALALALAWAGGLPQQVEAPAVLRRAPESLPVADEGRWEGWTPERAPEEPLRSAYLEALAAYEQGRLVPALELLYAVLEAEPDYPAALHQLGTVYFRLRRYGDARTAFERFLALAPAAVGTTRALGHAHYSLGRYELARAHYERVLAADPDELEARRGLALAHFRLGELEPGLELLDEVVRADPGHPEAHLWRARVLRELGRDGDALAATARARAAEPFDAAPWFLAAQLLRELGRDAEAGAAEARFRELDPAQREVRRLRALLAYEPDEVRYLERIARASAAVGDFRAAREALAQIVQRRPDDVAARLFALCVLADASDEAGARIVAGSIEREARESVEAWRALARFYGEVGDREGVLRARVELARLVGC